MFKLKRPKNSPNNSCYWNYNKCCFNGDIKRITSYGRSKTVAKKTLEELIELRDAGLSRLHIGLESGYDPVLQFMDKGTTAAEHIAGGRKVVESGISLSEYVLLNFPEKEWECLPGIIEKVIDCIKIWCVEGIEKAMNITNVEVV